MKTAKRYGSRFWDSDSGTGPNIDRFAVDFTQQIARSDRRGEDRCAGIFVTHVVTVANAGLLAIDQSVRELVASLLYTWRTKVYGVERQGSARNEAINEAAFANLVMVDKAASVGAGPSMFGLGGPDYRVVSVGAGASVPIVVSMFLPFVDPLGDGEIKVKDLMDFSVEGLLSPAAGLTVSAYTVSVFTIQRHGKKGAYLPTQRFVFVRDLLRMVEIVDGGLVECAIVRNGAGLGAVTMQSIQRGDEWIAESTTLLVHSGALSGGLPPECNLNGLIAEAPAGGGPTNAPFLLIADCGNKVSDMGEGDLRLEISGGGTWPAGTQIVGIMRFEPTESQRAAYRAELARDGAEDVIDGLGGKRVPESGVVPVNVLRYAPRRGTANPVTKASIQSVKKGLAARVRAG